jgi:hypothetical protein
MNSPGCRFLSEDDFTDQKQKLKVCKMYPTTARSFSCFQRHPGVGFTIEKCHRNGRQGELTMFSFLFSFLWTIRIFFFLNHKKCNAPTSCSFNSWFRKKKKKQKSFWKRLLVKGFNLFEVHSLTPNDRMTSNIHYSFELKNSIFYQQYLLG